MGNDKTVLIKEDNGTCRVFSGGEKVFECTVFTDPNKSHEILLKINSLKDELGTPIYANYKYREYYLWPMFQESLFWAVIQPLVKYEAVLAWLQRNQISAIETDITALAYVFDVITNEPGSRNMNRRLLISGRNTLERTFFFLNTLLCALYVRMRGISFLLYGVINWWGEKQIDYRLKDIYEQFWSDKIQFLETFYFPGFKLALRRAMLARRMVFYLPSLKAVKVKYHQYDLSTVQEFQQEILSKIVFEYEMRMAAVELQAKALIWMLKILGIKRIIGIDDHWTHAAMVVATRSVGIPLVGVQHGVFHKYSIGWICPGIPRQFNTGFDHIYVWGKYWVDLLSELSNIYGPKELTPAGFIRPTTIAFKPRQLKSLGNPCNILLPYEFLANPEEIADFVKAFLNQGLRIYFKIRFDDPLPVQLRGLPQDRLILVETLTQEILDNIDVCAGTSTTMMYELYYLGIPIWFLKTKHDSNIHMVEKGLATELKLSDLQSEKFNPEDHIIHPHDPETIFLQGGMPTLIAKLLKTSWNIVE